MRETLAAFIDEAEQKGLWLHSHYQDLWFSPAELRAQNAQGRFLWGVNNWRQQDPAALIAVAEKDVEDAKARLHSIRTRIAESGVHV